MKRPRLLLITAGLGLAGLVLLPGCSTPMHKQTVPDADYRKALSDTLAVPHPAPGSEVEAQALARVQQLFGAYTAENLAKNVRNVYADQLYFRDAFKQFTSAAEIEHYMLEGVKNLRSCSFEFEPPVSRGPDHFLRWTMVVNLKRDKPEVVERSLGMSHLRFNAEGKVIFHQDYWDPTDVVYTRIPVANWLIGKVKGMQ